MTTMTGETYTHAHTCKLCAAMGTMNRHDDRLCDHCLWACLFEITSEIHRTIVQARAAAAFRTP